MLFTILRLIILYIYYYISSLSKTDQELDFSVCIGSIAIMKCRLYRVDTGQKQTSQVLYREILTMVRTKILHNQTITNKRPII